MKRFRSPYLAIVLIFSILFASCSNGDYSTTDVTPSSNNKLNSNSTASRSSNDLITQNQILWEQAQKQYGNAGFKLTDELLALNNNDFETNWEIAVRTGLISESEKSTFKNLGNELVSTDFDTAISNFESEYLANGYKGTKLTVYQNIVESLKNTNTTNPTFFSRNGFDCGLAVVGFVGAFIGLATLTAATGGLLVGVAVVGYVGASVSLVRSCKE